MADYTLGHHESVLRSHRWRTVENSAAYLLPHLSPGMQLLDVGCGPGTITVGLGGAVSPGGTVLGVDASAAVIEQARADAAGVEDAVSFDVQDVSRLDLPDDAFDVVHAHQVLQHLVDPVAALREMGRVARPGGLVAVREADYAAMTWFPASEGMDRWVSVYRAVARRNRTDLDAGRQLLSWARQAGFEQVVPSASVWCFATAEDRSWWGGLQADRITQSAVADQALAAGLADAAALEAMAAAWRAWAAAEDGWFAVLHGEVLCRTAGSSPSGGEQRRA